MNTQRYDTIIIGGGFYGLRIAQFLREELGQKKVLVIEKEQDVMRRASYNNQARVHNGYHYPRSVLTALRSRVNLPVFKKEYEPAVVDDFVKYYAVAKTFSKVSAQQFRRFFERIEAAIEPAPEALSFFNSQLIDEVFKVQEYAFNSTVLKRMVLDKLHQLGVGVNVGEKAIEVQSSPEGIMVITDKNTYQAKYVLNTTYSSINLINASSRLPVVPLKHELTEMALVELPSEMKGKAFTIMCGPFFSLMPFPDKGVYTMSHVRYTPHNEWHDSQEIVRDSHNYMDGAEKVSHYPQMIADIKRYMPQANSIKYTGKSLWEVKTVLPQSEGDDSRPILYKEHHGGLRNYVCIMGGKIDNIYDVFRELKETYGQDS